MNNRGRLFITGASGFIGSHVVMEALRRGWEVAALVRRGDDVWRLAGSLDRIRILYGDLDELKGFAGELTGWRPDVCIHLAWNVEPGSYLESLDNIKCLNNTIELEKTMFDMGCSIFVAAGTCVEYGASLVPISEEALAVPQTVYAAAKLSACILGEQIAKKYGKVFSWGRIFFVYGPREDRRRMVPGLICSLTEGKVFQASAGDQIRDYLHVADVAAAFLVIVEAKASGVVNICSSVGIPVRDIMLEIKRQIPTGQIEFGAIALRPTWDPACVVGDNRCLRALGWEPGYRLSEGLADTISWWGQHLNSSRKGNVL